MQWLSELKADQYLTVALSFASALLGGLISIATIAFSASQNSKLAERNRKVMVSEREAFLAQQAFIKLLQYVNASFSMKKMIDQQFDDALEAGHIDMEPVQKVQEIIGWDDDFEVFGSEELVFLLHSKDANLLGELLIFEKSVLGHKQIVRSYNSKRSELFGLIREGIVGGGGNGGTVLSMELEGQEAVLANVQTSALNNMLGVFMHRLERDSSRGRALLDRFTVASKETYGDLYPSLKFEAPE